MIDMLERDPTPPPRSDSARDFRNRFQVRPPLRSIFAALAFAGAAHASAEVVCADLEAIGTELVAARDSNPADALERGEKVLAGLSFEPAECALGKARLLGAIASNLNVLGRNDEAVTRYQQAIERLGSAGPPVQVAFLHRGVGVALTELESYELALGHYLTALAASDAAGEQVESAKTAGNIGILYTTLGDFAKAREYQTRSLAAFEAADFKPGIAGALVNLGAVAAKFGEQALERGDLEAAQRGHQTLQTLNERALASFESLRNQRGVAYAASNIGLALDRLQRPADALVQHERSLQLRKDIGDRFGTINSLTSMVTSLSSLRRYDEAQRALSEAAALIPQESLNLRRIVEELRVMLAEARGDYRAALDAQRATTRIVTQIANEDQRAKVDALKDRFDADRAAREIELLRNEAAISDLELQRQQLMFRLSALIAALAIAFFLVLLSRYRIGVKSARKLAVAARTDPLTGLPNRRHLLELMEYEAHRVDRGGRGFCVLMADLDNFKTINDRHGHDIGDQVLCEVARRLRDTVRKQDTVARWGGEEFLLLLPDSNEAGALTLANKLRERIATDPISMIGGLESVVITVTIGFSEYRTGMSLHECIRIADEALYRGKRGGKNRAAG
ncbi:MAG: diguanylate cyclase [Dokdonella sp.]